MTFDKEALQTTLETSLLKHRVPGASVAILRQDRLITAAAGVANVSTGVQLTADTLMHIGSITKVFNATLIMQLVEEGRASLDDPVLRHLPDLKLLDMAALEQITVKMLLNHTSGIDGNMLPDYGHDEETIEKGIARFAALGQIHQPGAEFSYCNVGTVIAGYLAQRLTGKSWYRLIRERIFAPLQLKQAATLPEEALLHRASVGHFLRDGQLVRTSCAFLPMSFGPAGTSLMMSAQDLVLFAQAHIAQGMGRDGVRILSADAAQAMQRVTMDNGGKAYTYIDVGLGWMVAKDGLLTHSGGGPGIIAKLIVYPRLGFAAAVLTNAEQGLNVIDELMDPWFEALGSINPVREADLRPPKELVHIEPQRYSGVYEGIAARFTVVHTQDGLALSSQARFSMYDTTCTSPTAPIRLIPLGQDRFLIDSNEASGIGLASPFFRVVTFRNPDGHGRMGHLGHSLRMYRRIAE